MELSRKMELYSPKIKKLQEGASELKKLLIFREMELSNHKIRNFFIF